jgi:hypothetical protein
MTPTPARVEVVVLRDPDASNSYAVFINGREVTEQRDGATADGVTVVTYDIDAGATIEGADDDTVAEWAKDEREAAERLLTKAAAAHVKAVVSGYDRGRS